MADPLADCSRGRNAEVRLRACSEVKVVAYRNRGNARADAGTAAKAIADFRDSLAPDTTIAASLARHGIKAAVCTSVAADIGIGDEILSRVADAGADFLVMSAYGHSRMREIIFAGATRHLMRHMTVPTLFSH
jgi:nucleotide-binding universal stress UspA family protein